MPEQREELEGFSESTFSDGGISRRTSEIFHERLRPDTAATGTKEQQ